MKRAFFRMTDNLIVEILKGLSEGFSGRFIVEQGLPSDAKPIRTSNEGGITTILCESESFKDIKIGEIYPELTIIVKTLKDSTEG